MTNKWDYKSIKLLGQVVTGSTPKTSEETFYEGDIPFITPAELGNNLPILSSSRTLSAAGGEISRLLPLNSVMVCCIGSIGKVGISGRIVATNQQINSIIFNEDLVYPRFGFYACKLLKNKLINMAPSTTVPIVNKSRFEEIIIPVPPIAQQKRIAAILDQAEELRSKRRKSIGLLDELVRSVFLEMFGDPATNPKGWDIRKVSDYVVTFQGGKCIDAEDGDTVTRNRIVKVSAVTSMVFRPEESKPLPDEYEPPIEHFVKPGDLLFSRANTTELVGAIAYVQSTPPNIVLADKVWRFIWKEPNLADPLFIWALFQTPAMRYEIGRRATGTSGSMKNISQPKTLSIPTIFPPLPLQQQFAQRIQAIEALKATDRISLAKLDELFASLQHRAFRGEL